MVTFAPPRVTQFRNAHNYLADMDAEADLYVNRLFICVNRLFRRTWTRRPPTCTYFEWFVILAE